MPELVLLVPAYSPVQRDFIQPLSQFSIVVTLSNTCDNYQKAFLLFGSVHVNGIPAIYRDGAFYPLQPVELPEQTNVVVVLPQRSAQDKQIQGILRTAGVWADIPGVDNVLQELEDMRQSATYRDDQE